MHNLKTLPLAALVAALALALSGPPPAPSWEDTPAVAGENQITLHWRPAGGAVKEWRIRYRTSNSSADWVAAESVPANRTDCTVKGLVNLKSYEFQVGASDVSGAVAWSAKWHARPRGKSHPSGLHGGGQVNAIVKASGGIMVAGGDVSSFQQSLDGGETWYQSSRGLIQEPGSRGVVSLAFDRGSGALYGISGKASGHFWKSTDNGATWTHLSSGAAIAVEPNNTNYPRRVGRLIAIDPAHPRTIFVGTLAGIQKSTDGGVKWAPLALTGKIIRSLILDGGVLYAAAEGEGVYRCTPDGTLTVFNGGGAPAQPEEILALGGNLYVAANTAGVVRLKNPPTAQADSTWDNLRIGSTSARWCAIDGYIKNGNHVLVAGNAYPEQVGNSGRYTTVMKCANAQAAAGWQWINISSAKTTTVKTTLAAGNGETYWRVDPAKGEGVAPAWAGLKRLDGSVFAIDQILIDQNNPDKIHSVGQMGIWRTLDGGSTWEPAVVGLGAAVHNAVAADPRHPGWIYVGDTDNGVWVSHDHAESVAYCTRPPTGAKPTVLDIDVDAASGLVYVVVSGDIWSYDPVRRVWAPVKDASGKTLKQAAGGQAPHGVAVGQVSSSLVILAAVEESGFWRLASGGKWTRVSTGPALDSLSKKGSPFEWPAGTSLVYFSDGAGVWRSRDAGQTWTLIWKKHFGGGTTGSLAVTRDTTRLFVAARDGLFRLDGADTGSPAGSPGGIAVTQLAVPDPGRVTATGDTLWVTGAATSKGTANVALWKSTDGATFTRFKEDYYEGAAGFPQGLVVEPGFQYTAANSMGFVVSNR